jgi:hypothetical protein
MPVAQKKQKYHDVAFFLIAIAFISAFNYYLTYTNIKFNGFLLLTYAIDTVQGWLAWWAVRSIIISLDERMPYGNKPLRRILVQLVITCLTGMLVIILLTELTSLIAKGRTAPVSFYLFDVFIILVWFFVINGIYIGMHYYHEWKMSESNRAEEKKIRAGGIMVRQGNQDLLLPFGDVLGFFVENGYTALSARQGKKYILDSSLDKIEKTLPEEYFFRLNRQYIIHRAAISGFKRANDGKLDVLLNANNHFPGTIPVSRIKAAAFRSWFDPRESN